jgi:hypoxanthine-DNA glycosylase
MMASVNSFAPIEGESVRVLILGSIPGAASLAANEYYAHPQNSFWKVMGGLLGFAATLDYAQRIEALKRSHIAVWDVLESCIRPGSMDTDIDMKSAKANDIGALLLRQPNISCVCFNGSAAEKIFNTRILPTLNNVPIKYIRLPSTSPAHAAMSYQEKVAAWRAAILTALDAS